MLPRVFESMGEGDLLVLTADHGNDPTWKGTDHTRECVPILTYAKGMKPGSFGKRETFADIGQTIASHLAIPPLGAGEAWSV
jgi:phosphopentomutase